MNKCVPMKALSERVSYLQKRLALLRSRRKEEAIKEEEREGMRKGE